VIEVVEIAVVVRFTIHFLYLLYHTSYKICFFFNFIYFINLRENNLYEKYTRQTQIVALPGGIKREGNEINDNKSIRRTRCNSSSHFSKQMLDYSSAVSCLQGPEVNISIYQYIKL